MNAVRPYECSESFPIYLRQEILAGAATLWYIFYTMNLYDLICGYSSLSIAGMCKNAGKTTALGSILRNYPESETVALTSIGRDGEKEDVLTGAPKPAIYIRKGSIYATAEDLLPLCEAESEVLAGTGIFTPLGEVVLLKAHSDGNVELAGPSMVSQLVRLSQMFREHGADRAIFDGAMGRKSLCSRSLTEAAVLCTGAACGDSADEVVAETAHVCRLLTTPEDKGIAAEIDADNTQDCSQDCSKNCSSAGASPRPTICAFPGGGMNSSPKTIPGKYVLLGSEKRAYPEGADLTAALKEEDNPRILYIEGAATDRVISPLLRIKLPGGFTIAARDASKLLLSADSVRKMSQRGMRLKVLEGIRLAAVTVNPYSAFGACFDKTELIDKMAAAVPVPVINVKD